MTVHKAHAKPASMAWFGEWIIEIAVRTDRFGKQFGTDFSVTAKAVWSEVERDAGRGCEVGVERSSNGGGTKIPTRPPDKILESLENVLGITLGVAFRAETLRWSEQPRAVVAPEFVRNQAKVRSLRPLPRSGEQHGCEKTRTTGMADSETLSKMQLVDGRRAIVKARFQDRSERLADVMTCV